MTKNDTTTLVQVGKVVLTPEAIRCLEGLQSENNCGITAISEDIADAVCFIGRCITMIDDNLQAEACNSIVALSQARSTINELKKP